MEVIQRDDDFRVVLLMRIISEFGSKQPAMLFMRSKIK